MRRKRKYKKNWEHDIRYDSVAMARFINYLMNDGKKSVAAKVFYSALDIIKEKTGEEPNEVFDKAIKNASPTLEVKSRRVGGANYQVPREVRGERRFLLASRWIISAAKAKSGSPMAQRLANELMSAANREGEAIKKKTNVHRMAEANRAFAHFAW